MVKIVCCVSNAEETGYLAGIKSSCDRYDLELITLIHPTEWGSHRLKDIYLKEFLKGQTPDQIVLFSDGYDTVFVNDSTDIYNRYLGICREAQILISAEVNCYPDPSITQNYPELDTSYRFVNSGGIIGRAGDLLRALTKIESHLRDTRFGWSNQYLWSKLYLGGDLPMKLDSKCSFFQTMSSSMESTNSFVRACQMENWEVAHEILDAEVANLVEDFDISPKAVFNKHTYSEPLHIHFNGPIMKQLMFHAPLIDLLN